MIFNPTRLSFARKRRGLSKRQLADATGIESWTISKYETGERCPSAEAVGRFSAVLDFPASFFSGDDVEVLDSENASFRSLSKMTAGQRDSALAAGSLAIELGRWIDKNFRLPECRVPDLHDLRDPEAAAVLVRQTWGLGERPISNLVHLLESQGVRVFSLVEDCVNVDAFSVWDGSTPYILLNTVKSPERSRFDAAHELGHLVLHRHGKNSGRTHEEEANAFASALLMPGRGVLASAPRTPSIHGILQGKLPWGVSAVAFAFRLHRLGVLTDWHYHDLVRKLSAQGFRSGENSGRPRETSQVLGKVFDILRQSGQSRFEIAKALHISPNELNALIFGLTLSAKIGGGSPPTGSSLPARTILTLVPKPK